MSRATICLDMIELSTVWWNSLTSKQYFICKICANAFLETAALQKHKLPCYLDIQTQHRHGHGHKYSLSQVKAEKAASAVISEYAASESKEEQLTKPESEAKRKPIAKGEKTRQKNLPVAAAPLPNSSNKRQVENRENLRRLCPPPSVSTTIDPSTSMLSLSASHPSFSGFKGFRIPKKKTLSPKNVLECDSANSPTISKIKVEVEASDYGSYNSSTSSSENTEVDCSRVNKESTSITTKGEEYCDEQAFIAVKEVNEHGELIPVEYVIVKTEELEFVDVYTECDGDEEWLIDVKEGVLLQVVDYEGNDNAKNELINEFNNSNISAEAATPFYIKTEDEVSSTIPDNNNCYNDYQQVQVQEALDLELGAEETVESSDSFQSDDGIDCESINLENSPYFGLNSSTPVKSDPNCKHPPQQKFSPQSKLHSPTTLLNSVLEKTLLVRLRRCDALVGMCPSQRIKKPKSNQSQTNAQNLPEVLAAETTTNNVLQPIPYDTLKSTDFGKDLKRKHKEKGEKWDIVDSSSNLKADDASSSTTTIKLKIKRRREESMDQQQQPEASGEHKQSATKNPKQDTSLVQYFNGMCNICGSRCKYEDAKTYYISNEVSKPFSCCTCFNLFSQAEWPHHNKRCCREEQVEAGHEEPDGNCDTCDPQKKNHASCTSKAKIIYGTVIKRDFLCKVCFKAMSKSNDIH